MKICVVGDGAWGTALAINALENKHDVVIWGAFPEYLDEIRTKRENRRFLPGVRLPDELQFEYDIKELSFTLPALTVQPLVENAVNHGIRYHKMKGRVKISSYSDDKNCYVVIEDDGVGFDPDKYMLDGRKHVGISNVKYRLEVLCGGSLDIKSEKNKGTVVTIRIPKEK